MCYIVIHVHTTFVYLYPQETQLSCTGNKNGTLIDCELGNPFQRDAEVSIRHLHMHIIT